MEGTLWAFVPALVAIVLALLTKHVYISLFVGVLTGAMFLAGGNPLQAMGTLYTVMAEKVGGNVPIIVFLVILGIFVVLMQESGGATAYGQWASNKIKSRKGALGMTAGLGCLIFMDDYFNCLTVGSVMRPLTDKYKVSRSKLAYLIDSTAAPICIIAPISSWAAALAGELEGNAIMTFIKTIPFNIYALLTIVMVFAFIFLKIDFGKMRRDQEIADKTGDLNAGLEDMEGEGEMKIVPSTRGKVRHLVVPVVVLILCCIGGMIYSGYFYNWGSTLELNIIESNLIQTITNSDGSFTYLLNNNAEVISVLNKAEIALASAGDGLDIYYFVNSANQIELFVNYPVTQLAISEMEIDGVLQKVATLSVELEAAGYGTAIQSSSVIEAFSNCDSGSALAIGSTFALIIIAIYYLCSKVVSFKDMMESIPQGFKTMVPAILILVFAWTISGIMGAKGGYLDAQAFVENNIANSNFPTGIYPAIFFLLASGIAFATGTSWGTFGVLVPIAVTLLGGAANESTLMIMTISATLGGAVFGDHVSPISDTTILASAGANYNHVNHVRTQLPYAGMVAIISFVAYIVAGFMATSSMAGWLVGIIMWVLVAALAVGTIFVIKKFDKKTVIEEPTEE